jgi:hypothetical protein
MPQHKEDSASLQIKIGDDGILWAYCPKSNKLWATQLHEVPTPQTQNILAADNEIYSARGRVLTKNMALSLQPRVRTQMTANSLFLPAAEKAFPDLFTK